MEHSLLVLRMAVEHSLQVYRMAVEHSLLRRRRSARSLPGDMLVDMWLSFHYACILTAFRVRFFIQSNISHCPSLLTLPMQL